MAEKLDAKASDEAEGEGRSPEELEQRAHILKRLTGLKRARFGSRDFWQGCEEVEIATAKGFQVVSVQDAPPVAPPGRGTRDARR